METGQQQPRRGAKQNMTTKFHNLMTINDARHFDELKIYEVTFFWGRKQLPLGAAP
jgi:hypothetical protein